MASNCRADNQYYGKYRECCVVAHLNNTPVEYNEDYVFSDKEKIDMYEETRIIADYIGNHRAIYIGNHTIDASGDIVLDNGEVVELKCVSSGNGTYFNTSIYYLSKFGFDFREYMDKYNIYSILENKFGNQIKVSRTNNSPVSQSNSSFIRHNYESFYKNIIIPADAQMRHCFTLDIADYFRNNVEAAYQFVSDMLSKNTSTCFKKMPDRLIVMNYNKKTAKEINLKSFVDNITTTIRVTDKGLVIGNVRIIFAWQNGSGLNNPTIRVFLED